MHHMRKRKWKTTRTGFEPGSLVTTDQGATTLPSIFHSIKTRV